MDKIAKEKAGLIGYGYWGKKLYRYLRESKLFDLVYVHFPSLKKQDINSIHQGYGKEFVPSLETIWDDKSVSQVIIATPINTHFSVAKEALLNSKNVMVEKPLTLKGQEADFLKNLAQQNQCVLMTEYTYTFSKALKQAQDLLQELVIGNIESIEITLKQLGRFLEYDVFTLLGSHALSILDMFVPLDKGDFSVKPLIRTKDLITGGRIDFKLQQKVCGSIHMSLHSPEREKRVVICGEKGTITYDPYEVDTVTLVLYERTPYLPREDLIQERKCFTFDENHNLRYALEEFYEVIQKRSSDNSGMAICITKILEALSNQIY